MSARRRLLIIDDDPDFAEGIKSTLEGADYDVDVAYNPRDGIQALQTRRYDLLLLDIMMGRGAEGIMIARKLAKDSRFRDLPVLVMTGIKEQIDFLFPGEPGPHHIAAVDGFVEKPIEPQFLLARVSELLEAAEKRKAQIHLEDRR